MQRVLLTAGALVVPVVLCGQAAPPASQRATPPSSSARPAAAVRKLPVKRVVLYKNGVGFFEHLGQVSGTERLSIDFTSAQLDDALKSLTVIDMNGGRIGAVGYNSDAPLERRLGALNLPLENGTTAAALIGALKGARIEVTRAGASATGRLLGVERRSRGERDRVFELDELSLVSDGGDVRVFELGPGTSVRLIDRDLTDRVGRYLGLVAAERDRNLRRMTIEASGEGNRRLYVSYVSEVPVWKTTYRLVLPEKPGDKALLQGWAIVDNTVGEDWDDVALSLVAGAPVSFVQQLSQPLYTTRPVIPLPSNALLAPQTHAGTMTTGAGGVAGHVTDESGTPLPGASIRITNAAGLAVASGTSTEDGSFRFDGLPSGAYTLVAELAGFRRQATLVVIPSGGIAQRTVALAVGALTEAVTVTGEPAPPPPPAAAPLRLGGNALGGRGGVVGGVVGGVPQAPPADYAGRMAAQAAAASGRDLGDLFEYTLDRPVSIKQNQSALVPILQSPVSADRVSLWSEHGAAGERPLTAVWLTNSSAYTLDAGTLTLLDRNTYAGEALTEAIKPGERRLVSYAVDLAMRVQKQASQPTRRVSRVRASNGVLLAETLTCAEHTYTARNEDTAARVLVVEHPQSAGWTLAPGTAQPAETSSTAYRFSVPVEPKRTASLVIREAHAEEARFALSDVSDDQVGGLGRDVRLDPRIVEQLRSVSAKRAEIAGVERDLAAKDSEQATIGADQERVRENMKVLKGSAEEKRLLERYVQQLAGGEDRLAALAQERTALVARREHLQAELQAFVTAVTFDAAGSGAAACGS